MQTNIIQIKKYKHSDQLHTSMYDDESSILYKSDHCNDCIHYTQVDAFVIV